MVLLCFQLSVNKKYTFRCVWQRYNEEKHPDECLISVYADDVTKAKKRALEISPYTTTLLDVVAVEELKSNFSS